MTDELENFQNLVWSSLSPIRKRIVGRERVNDLIAITIEQSPVRLLHHVVSGSTGEQVVVDEWHTGVRRMYCLLDSQFGPIFWLLLWAFSRKYRRQLRYVPFTRWPSRPTRHSRLLQVDN